MKRLETTQLFYNKYCYKLQFNNALGSIFRHKNLSYAAKILDDLYHKNEEGLPLFLQRHVRKFYLTQEDFKDARILYNKFRKKQDFMIRIENPVICIYSNDLQWLEDISSELLVNDMSLFLPDTNYKSLLDKDTILKDNCEYKYRVTINHQISYDLGVWLENNKNRVKCKHDLIEELKNNGFAYGRTFYVKNEKDLTIVSLIAGSSLKKIQRIVTKQNFDK